MERRWPATPSVVDWRSMDPDQTLPPEAPPTMPAPPMVFCPPCDGVCAIEDDFDGFAGEELDES